MGVNPGVPSHVRIFESSEKLYKGAAEFILNSIPPGAGPFSLALSGGSTPAGLFRTMASEVFRNRFPWERIHFFWCDERWVPHTDARSNFKMAKEFLLDRAEIPRGNIHPVPTSLASPAACAQQYEEDLRRYFAGNEAAGVGSMPAPDGRPPAFDLILLGLGEDGHTASLFSGDPACEEQKKWVTAARLESSEPRITLSFPVIQSARLILFLVSGKQKKAIVEKILKREKGFEHLPAGRIRPLTGKPYWFIDAEAGSLFS